MFAFGPEEPAPHGPAGGHRRDRRRRGRRHGRRRGCGRGGGRRSHGGDRQSRGDGRRRLSIIISI